MVSDPPSIKDDPWQRQPVLLTATQRQELEAMLRRTTLAAGRVRRVRAILLLADGYSVSVVGRMVAMPRRHLYKWMGRFGDHGLAGLSDAKRTGRPPVFPPEVVVHPVKIACERPDDVGRSLSHGAVPSWLVSWSPTG